MSESSTSAPCVIIVHALCTHVMSPPFLNLLPFADEMTTGFTDLFVMMFGDDWARRLRAAVAARPAPTVVRTKSRRFIRQLRLFFPNVTDAFAEPPRRDDFLLGVELHAFAALDMQVAV